MKKQISHPDLITRVFCTCLDLLFLATIITVVEPLIRKHSCLFSLKEIITENHLDSGNISALESFFRTYKFSSGSDATALLMCRAVTPVIEMILISSYMLFFWWKFGQTPAKFLMRLKVVDSISFEKPSFWQLIKRLLFSILYPIGILFIAFTRQKQALHDLASGTLVIKS